MDRSEAIKWLKDIHHRFNPTGEKLENEGGDVHLQALDMAIEALEDKGLFDQYKWERDVAMETLKEHGLVLGQKKMDASAEPKTGRDCTDFVRWLMDEVMDEENWQMNAVANGEIICRKLKKLGLLDVIDGYYVETQKTGRWILEEQKSQNHVENIYICSSCRNFEAWGKEELYNFCPNCGARMKGADDETD